MAAYNPVLESVRPVVEKSRDVSINMTRLKEVARGYSEGELPVPDWRAPVFPSSTDRDTIAFLLLGNSINFAFSDIRTGVKYENEYQGIPFSGAFGMWAALKRGLDNGVPILDAKFLQGASDRKLKSLFDGTAPMPMLFERISILREVGKVLSEKYDSHFANVVERSRNRAFNGGSGTVERLLRDFPSFDDHAWYGGRRVVFNKRAQLAVAMIQGRFLSEYEGGLFPRSDIDLLTVFADYELPKTLNALGILDYSNSLSERISTGKTIWKGSPEEVEIRANTIYAAKLIEDEVNGLIGGGVNALNIDFRLWSEGRGFKDLKHHLTYTTAY